MDNNTKFRGFVESLRTEDNSSSLDAILEGFSIIYESEKWAKDVKVKKGKMKKLLDIPEDKKVCDVYTSGEKLAKDLVSALDGDQDEAASMLAFAANVDKKDNVLDSALRYLKKM